jgi:hypothetical protein
VAVVGRWRAVGLAAAQSCVRLTLIPTAAGADTGTITEKKNGVTMKRILTATLCAGLLAVSASLAAAAPITLHVDVNTAPLIGSGAGPFSIDFQLTDGSGTLAVPNTATVSNFVFAGSSAAGSPSLIGGATGILSSTVSLTDSGAFFNEFFQAFNPGSRFSFDLTLTRNVDPGPTPDAFSFGILDGSLANIPTNGVGDALVLVNIDSANLAIGDVRTFSSTGPAGVGVTASAVPEPTSLLLASAGLAAVAMRRWRQGAAPK